MAFEGSVGDTDGLSVDDACALVGGLSRTAKMPCHSWGVPVAACKLGAVLARREGSVCRGCYARRGNYLWPTVRRAQERRFERASYPGWVDAMTVLVQWQARVNCQPYFRWFDSGDLQSVGMLERIAQVAAATPEIRHWLPTREYQVVRTYLERSEVPANLTVRVSAHDVDARPPRVAKLPTSTVHLHEPPHGFVCPAYQAKPVSCFTCRACWDPGVVNVSYQYH